MYVLTAKIIASTALLANSALAVPVAPRTEIGPEVFYGPGPVIAETAKIEAVKAGKNTEDPTYILDTPEVTLPEKGGLNVWEKVKHKGTKIAPQIFHGPGPVIPEVGNVVTQPENGGLNVKLEEVKPKGTKIAPSTFHGPGPVIPEVGNVVNIGGAKFDDPKDKEFQDSIKQAVKVLSSLFTPHFESLHTRDDVDDSKTGSVDGHIEGKASAELAAMLKKLMSSLSHLTLPFVPPKVHNHWNLQNDKVTREVAKDAMLVVPDVDMDAWMEFLEQNQASLQFDEAQA